MNCLWSSGGPSLPGRLSRGGILLLWVFLPVAGLAQIPGPDRTRDTTRTRDSVRTVDSARVPTYEEIRREYERLIRARADSGGLVLDSLDGERTVGLGGLVIDETRSPMGSRFYQVFSTRWDPPEQLGSYTVVIREQPSPGLGSFVAVVLDDELVFRARLGPRGGSTRQAAERAVQIARRRLAERSAGSPSSPLRPR